MKPRPERTEDDIVAKAPVSCVLGSETYEIKPLTLIPARKWRDLLVKTMNELIRGMVQPEDPDKLGPALTAILIAYPDRLCELVYAYSPALREAREKIEDEETGATEEQMAGAYAICMQFAYPLLGQFNQTTTVLQQASR